MSAMELLLHNGFMSVGVVILFAFGLFIIFEKYSFLKKAKVNVGSFTIKIRGMLKRKDFEGAINFCTEEKSPVANIVKRGLRKNKFGRKRMVDAFETAAKLEIIKLEKNIPLLATLSKLAPLVGFLGVVISFTFAYLKMNTLQNFVVKDFNNEIYGAILSSGLGLLAGIILTILYNQIISLIKRNVFEMEMVATEIIDVLDENIPKFADDLEPEILEDDEEDSE